MSDTPQAVDINCETGEVTYRDLIAEEIAAQQAAAAQAEADRQAREAEAAKVAELKASAKAKLVAGQPLTEEEASTIVI
jgi:hypothetical protein